DLRLAQVDARFGVEEDPAAADDEEVEALDLRDGLGARELAHRHGPIHAVPALRVLGVAREHRDLDRQGAPPLRNHRVKDRLVAEVQAAVRAGNSDAVQVLGHARVSSKKNARAHHRPLGRLDGFTPGLPAGTAIAATQNGGERREAMNVPNVYTETPAPAAATPPGAPPPAPT